MVRVPKSRSHEEAAGAVEANIAQTQYMIGIYAEILAMDKAIMERIRQIVVRNTGVGDREADLTNLRLLLGQLEKIGQRIAYWNARLRSLVKGQLTQPSPRQLSAPRPAGSLPNRGNRSINVDDTA